MRGPGPKCREKNLVTYREAVRQTPDRVTNLKLRQPNY